LHDQRAEHGTGLARPDRAVVEDTRRDESIAVELVASELVLGVAGDSRVADNEGAEELIGVSLEGGATRSESAESLFAGARGEAENDGCEAGAANEGERCARADVTVQDQILLEFAKIMHS
jgi:hypothetical protein